MNRHYLILTLLFPIFISACSDNDEPWNEDGERHVIEFAEPFVSHVSRSVTQPGFNAFRLYGFVHRPDSYIYNGETVHRESNDRWVCDRTEYWYPGHIYYFTGLAPADAKGLDFTPAIKGNGTIPGGGLITYDISATGGHEDLLYAFTTYRSPKQPGYYIPPVEMEFQHLLSQLTFTFHNDLGNPHYFINCPNIVIGDICGKASIDMTRNEPEWQASGQTTAWIGTNTEIMAIHTGQPRTSTPLYVLPVPSGNAKIIIYTQVFYTPDPYSQTGNPVTEINTIEVPLPEIDFKAGRAYNLVCHLNYSNVEGDGGTLQPITFSVEDGKWKYDYYIDTP